MANKEAYRNELKSKVDLLSSQLKALEGAKGNVRTAHVLLAASTACDTARWLRDNPNFLGHLETLQRDIGEDGDAIAELTKSVTLYNEFIAAERQFLLDNGLSTTAVSALLEGAGELRPTLLRPPEAEQILARLGALRDLVCDQKVQALAKISKPEESRLRKGAQQVFWVGGGASVIALNKLGGLALVMHTLGLAAPIVAVADAASSSLGGAMLGRIFG